MALPEPSFLAAHGVLQPPGLLAVDPAQDEKFIAAARGEFPNLVSRQVLPPDVPPMTPHLALASTSSQLVVSRAQADFEVRFYGDYLHEVDRSLDYVERKLDTTLRAFQAIDVAPSMVGIIATFHFSFEGMEDDGGPAAHILRTHFRQDFEEGSVQDAIARVALRVDEKYFVTLTVSNYESRSLQRPVMPGMPPLKIRPWEGELTDTGIELAVDINNNLEARVAEADPVVTETGIRAMTGLLRRVAMDAGRSYAETGRVTVAELAGDPA